MKHPNLILAALFPLLMMSAVRADDWKPANGPLKTRWAKDVSPTNALPKYPRPQMVRADWLNLNGLWDLKLGDGTETKILVPYPIESALSGVMKHSDRMTYKRGFEIPKSWGGRHVLLHFGAVDWETKVSVNGKEVGTHRGGYDPFEFDITDKLKSDGKQNITVEVFDPTNLGGQARGKQTLQPGGIMYTPTSGIWQTVWLEPVAPTHIESLKIVPDVDKGTVSVRIAVAGGHDVSSPVTEAEVEVSIGQKKIGVAVGTVDKEIVVKIPEAKLWSPDSPFLYDMKVTIGREVGVDSVDGVTSYFGMRKIALAKDWNGVTRINLNNKPVFEVGPLDQGFWPDGIYTAPTDEALRWDIAEMKILGFNCVRKHVKVEPDRWYYWCDKLGLLVWQDMPCVNSYTDKPQPIDVPQFKTELERLVTNHWNHPCIIMWVIFNEAQGQHDTEALVTDVKTLDPSRLVNNASGGNDMKCGDVIDMHNYPGPGSPAPEANRAAVLGEFGGLGLTVNGHLWAGKTWGYKGTEDIEGLTKSYEKLLTKAWGLNVIPGLSAAIYTQLTDVETEGNGLLTYDREVNKVIAERATAVNSGNLPPAPVLKEVVPTSQTNGINWRYTTDKPADDWMKAGFDDSSWKEGPGGFGTNGTPGAVVRTEWKTGDIWLRRTIDWPATATGTPAFRLHHDEDVEIHINGVLAGKADGFISEYEEMPMTKDGVAALKPGKNVIAVHCHQTTGGQYIDVGINTETPPPPAK